MTGKEISRQLKCVGMENDREFRKVTAPLPKSVAAALDDLCAGTGFAKQRVIAAGIQLFLAADQPHQAAYYMAAYGPAAPEAPPTAPAGEVGRAVDDGLRREGRKRKPKTA